MANRQTLTLDQLKAYLDQVNQQGIAVVSTIYQELDSKGYAYAGWANGVATGDAITGQAALDFMQSSAHTDMTMAQITLVRIGMLTNYLTELIKMAEISPSKSINEDVNFATARDFHNRVFIANGLTINNWTLEAPMNIVNHYLGGPLK